MKTSAPSLPWMRSHVLFKLKVFLRQLQSDIITESQVGRDMKRDMKRQTEKINTHYSELKPTCIFTSCLALENGSYLGPGGEPFQPTDNNLCQRIGFLSLDTSSCMVGSTLIRFAGRSAWSSTAGSAAAVLALRYRQTND